MHFWRICRRRYPADAATAEGARLYGGLWNGRGVRVVYASASLSLLFTLRKRRTRTLIRPISYMHRKEIEL